MQTEELYSIFLQHNNVITDSRQVVKDSVYFALKGENFDGNDFAIQAVEKGCAFAVVDKVSVKGDKIIHVPDVLNALQELASFHRKKMTAKILAITGTNGKTTTKELISAVLSTQKNIIYTQGNLNNHIGVPLTLLSIKKETEIAVVEMGANHPGEIDFLCNIADPDFGLVTNVGVAHIEGFGSFDGVVNTKTELYRYIHKRKKLVFVNSGNEHLMKHSDQHTDIYYSAENNGNVTGKIIGSDVFVSVSWKYCNAPEQIIKTQITGTYNLENILAAISIGKYFGISDININNAIAGYKPSNKRSQLVKTAKNEIVLDAYNANPTSTKAALENFFNINKTDKVLILGDMFELGKESDNEHKKILDLISSFQFKRVYLVGNKYYAFKDNYPYNFYKDTGSIVAYFQNNPVISSFILLKGSRGMKMENLLGYL